MIATVCMILANPKFALRKLLRFSFPSRIDPVVCVNRGQSTHQSRQFKCGFTHVPDYRELSQDMSGSQPSLQ